MEPRIDLNKEYGLVLEGGGARGAYQVGAWRALREAGIKIKGVAGTSVGALNGALICMDEFEKAEEIWWNIKFSRVLNNVEDEVIESLKRFDVSNEELTELAANAKKIFTDRGLDITPLKELIAETIDEEKIRNSPIEFFATTLSLTDRKEINFDVRKAPEGTMKDMVLASAYLPGFKSEKLGGKLYMDGGTVNNVPVNVLTDRGYKDVIVIRIHGIGIDREKLFDIPEDVDLYRIEPQKKLGNGLDFDTKRARRNMQLGYYDAQRFLYGLCGTNYYIDLPDSEAYCFERLMAEQEHFGEFLGEYMVRTDTERYSGYRACTEKLFPAAARKLKLSSGWNYRDLYGALLEACAKKLKLEVFSVYMEQEILSRICDRLTGVTA